MQVRLPSFVQNISFNSVREVALRNPLTVAVAAVALGVFALYSLYTWWTTPKSFTVDSSSSPALIHPMSARALAALVAISASDQFQLANVLGLGEFGHGIVGLPEFKENIAQADGLSIRSKMTAPMMFGVFTDGNPFVAIAVDSVSGASLVQEAIILIQDYERNGNSLKKVWSQLRGTSGDESQLFPYFFDKNFMADLLEPREHPTVKSYCQMQILCKNVMAQDRNGNYWTLATFES